MSALSKKILSSVVVGLLMSEGALAMNSPVPSLIMTSSVPSFIKLTYITPQDSAQSSDCVQTKVGEDILALIDGYKDADPKVLEEIERLENEAADDTSKKFVATCLREIYSENEQHRQRDESISMISIDDSAKTVLKDILTRSIPTDFYQGILVSIDFSRAKAAKSSPDMVMEFLHKSFRAQGIKIFNFENCKISAKALNRVFTECVPNAIELRSINLKGVQIYGDLAQIIYNQIKSFKGARTLGEWSCSGGEVIYRKDPCSVWNRFEGVTLTRDCLSPGARKILEKHDKDLKIQIVEADLPKELPANSADSSK